MNIRAWHLPLFLIGLSYSFHSLAAETWLAVPQDTLISPGHSLTVEIVKPQNATWPEQLGLLLDGAGGEETMMLAPTSSLEQASDRRTYKGQPNSRFTGLVKARLTGVSSNQFLLQASLDDDVGPLNVATTDATDAKKVESRDSPTIVIAQPGDEPGLSANEPTYFVVGSDSRNGADARFQLSFKYRLFDPESSLSKFSPLFSNLYFTYTQTSLWDLGDDSSPFRDTSYRPGIYYGWAGSGKDWLPSDWRAGLEHESNGQSGADSRSINIAYLKPIWHMDLDHGKRLTFLPKIYHYIDKSDNDDIQRYRGYADWTLRYGREDGLIVHGMYRQGTAGYASGQLDLSYPLSTRIFARTGTFVHLQLFSGYGETLLDYDRDRDTQLRIGFSIAR
jgi:phospholipase A1